jgi:hypothetical protein
VLGPNSPESVSKGSMKESDSGRRASKAHNKILIVFTMILSGFFLLTMANELLDIPHYLFGDAPTLFEQRRGEVFLEIIIYAVVIIAGYVFYNRLQKRINILEGMLSICANCKKIRQGPEWVVLEEYISSHSHAEFTHALCPDCIRQLYPEIADKVLSSKEAKETA